MATYSKDTENGRVFMKGDMGEPCADCNWVPDYLCDFPVGANKTCDRLMCEDHANRVSDDIHYCDTHFRMWKNFIDGGDIGSVLPAKILKMEE